MTTKKRKTKEELQDITYLCITVHYNKEYTRDPCDDGWDLGDMDCTYFGVTTQLHTFKGTLKDAKNYESHPKNGDTIFVVIEFADEGSTFGTEENVPYERGWFKTKEEAIKFTEKAKPSSGYFTRHRGWRIEETTVGFDSMGR